MSANTAETSHAPNNFHFIRILAAILVIISHSYALLGLPEEDLMWKITNHTFSFSYFGLMIFFIISGYLITKSARPERRMGFKNAIAFLQRRFLRIFPALVVLILLTTFVLGPIFSHYSLIDYFKNPQTWNYLNNLTLFNIQGPLPGVFMNEYGYITHVSGTWLNGSLWTLYYEFTLYILILVLAVIGILKFRYLLTLMYILAIFWLYPIIPLHNTPDTLSFLNLNIFALSRFTLFFLSGMLLYLFKDKIPMKFSIFTFSMTLMIIGWHSDYPELGNHILLPYIIIYLAQIPCRLNKLAAFGDYSYGMYIYAAPVQKIISYFFPNLDLWIMIPYSVIATFPLAYLSWHLIESKMPALKRIHFEEPIFIVKPLISVTDPVTAD